MRVLPLLFFCLVGAAQQASAAIATLGASAQNFTLTGIGGNASLEGQNTVSWGTCAFDGTNTNCTLTGPFTGFGGGGTYSFVVSYPGKGAFPLIAVSTTPGGNFFSYQAQSAFSLVITLTESGNGASIIFYSFANFSFFYQANATCRGVATCAVGQVGLTPGATITGPIIGSFDPTPTVAPSGVISASGYGGFSAIAPSTWIEIYGYNLATNTQGRTWAAADFSGFQAPTILGGTSVTVDGLPAYVYYVSPGQVNVQVPSGVPSGLQQVVVTTAGGTSSAYTVQVNALEPGLLSPATFNIKGSQYVVALFSGTLTYVLPVAVTGIQTQRAFVGSNLTLYAIGMGLVTPGQQAGQVVQGLDALQSPLQIYFGGVPATVTYQGFAPGYVGLYQINLVVPSVPASDTVPVTFNLGGQAGPQTLVTAVFKVSRKTTAL